MLVLGHIETGNPKDVTQQDSTLRPQNCLIGRYKDMMSSMDPMRTLGMQEEAAETSLATRKFSSSIFCWEELHKSQAFLILEVVALRVFPGGLRSIINHKIHIFKYNIQAK